MQKLYFNMLDLIGHTPIVKLNGTYEGYKPKNLYVKLEYFNPAGSIKDRVAFFMLKTALDKGEITKDTFVIEPTSGNTGIGLAFASAVLGLKFIAVMPENMSLERMKLIKAYGAKIVLTPKLQGMKGSVDKAADIAQHLKDEGKDAYIPFQFSNPNNPKIHYLTTAQEIFDDTEGKVDIVLAGVGTGGTISGIGKKLKELKPGLKTYGIEAAESPLLTEGKVGPHKIQGISANFIPQTLNMEYVDGIIDVKGDDALNISRQLASKEGVLVGISSGAVVKAGLDIDKNSKNNEMIICVLADNGERYLSGELFE